MRSWGCEGERSGNVQQASYTRRMGERRGALLRILGGGADEKRRVPDSGGLGVLVMTEFTGSVLVKW